MPSHVAKFLKRNSLLLLDATTIREKLMPPKPVVEPLKRHRAYMTLEYFLSHVDQCDRLDLCWNWKTAKPVRYGYLRHEGRSWLAHRWLYTLLYGPIPASCVVHHKCENGLCSNPCHLECMDRGEHQRLHIQNLLCQ